MFRRIFPVTGVGRNVKAPGSTFASAAAPAVWFAYSPDRKGEHPEVLNLEVAARRLPLILRRPAVYHLEP